MNFNRRNFLKFLLIGALALLLERIFRGSIAWFSKENKKEVFLGFKIKEENDGLSFYNQQGEKILLLDKEKANS